MMMDGVSVSVFNGVPSIVAGGVPEAGEMVGVAFNQPYDSYADLSTPV